jgi:ATP phosphoribosyltransferase
MNGLREVELVLKSEAVLISYPDMAEDKQKILEQLLFRIRAVNTAREYKYILLNAPNDKVQDIIKILPGMKAPTLLPLSQEGWSSLHSVIKEQDFWEVIDQLKSCGAEGILVAPIEKMIL